MKKVPESKTANIAEKRLRLRMMRETVEHVQKHGELWIPLMHLAATFIDGLAQGKSGETRRAYLTYLKAHFPELCADLGAEAFYSYFRCASVHEFAIRPPFALWRESDMGVEYAETVEIDGVEFTALNIDRLVRDFLSHLRKVEASQ